MIRKSISFALAGLLIVVPALAFLIWLFGHWQPGSRLVEGLIFCFAVGVIWLGTEIWPAPGLDDTQLSKSGLPLELHRAQITDRRVSAFRVVEALDIVKHVCLCFIARPVRFVAGALRLQRREKAFHRGVVPHVA